MKLLSLFKRKAPVVPEPVVRPITDLDVSKCDPLRVLIIDETTERIPEHLGITPERVKEIEIMVMTSNMHCDGKSMAMAAASWTGLKHANELFLATYIMVRMNTPQFGPMVMRYPSQE